MAFFRKFLSLFKSTGWDDLRFIMKHSYKITKFGIKKLWEYRNEIIRYSSLFNLRYSIKFTSQIVRVGVESLWENRHDLFYILKIFIKSIVLIIKLLSKQSFVFVPLTKIKFEEIIFKILNLNKNFQTKIELAKKKELKRINLKKSKFLENNFFKLKFLIKPKQNFKEKKNIQFYLKAALQY